MDNNKNSSIGCSVKECKYHCGDCNCCSRHNIEVSACTNYGSAHTSDATCCRSFEEKTF